MSSFSSLHPVLQEVLISSLKWSELRPVQEETCAAILGGADVLVLAPTAGGKTESAFIPVIDSLLKNPTVGSVKAIYLSPLKALINDQTQRVTEMCARAGISVAVQHGDVKTDERWNFNDIEYPDILLTTPESLEVLVSDKHIIYPFSDVSFIIIDEIHAFMENDRGVHLKCLIDRLTLKSRTNPLRIGLSATVGNPDELLLWLSAENRQRKLIQVPAPQTKKQFSFVVESDFTNQTEAIIHKIRGKKVLVFCDSRSISEKLFEPLKAGLENVYLHHSAVSVQDRETAELSFASDFGNCVICTSTMELGIDIGELDMVVQYGPPRSVSSFLQRLGRSGRRNGRPASMTFILKDACELLTTLGAIEAASRHEVESLKAPICPYNVFIQQLFLLLKGKPALSRKSIFVSLKALSSFAFLSTEEIDTIITYLEENNYLIRTGDLFSFGIRAEAELGKRNWLTLISLINDSGGYLAVLPDGTPVGKLDPRFIGTEPGKIFTFTGKTWRLLHRDDVHRCALIKPSSAKHDIKRPFWSANSQWGISSLICQSVSIILARGESILPLGENEAAILEDLLSSLPDDFEPGKIHLRIEPEVCGYSVVVSTFAGFRVNEVLARLVKNRLACAHTFHVTDFAVRFMDFEDKKGLREVEGILESVQELSWVDIISELPEVPVSVWKFAEMLPEEMVRKMRAFEWYMIGDVQEILKKNYKK